ncbi:hypothetical protein QTP88_026280 [Uroleucon formosanum]
MAEIKMLGETKLIYGGFIHLRSKLPVNGKTSRKCQKLDDHNHVSNQEDCELEMVQYSLKRKAEDQPNLPPAKISRTDEMAGLSDGDKRFNDIISYLSRNLKLYSSGSVTKMNILRAPGVLRK